MPLFPCRRSAFRTSFAALLVVASVGCRTITADIVILNGTVLTVDPTDRVAEAVAITGDRIVAVGTTAEMRGRIGPKTRVIDLVGRTLTPGLIDSHLHFSGAAIDRFRAVDLSYVGRITDVSDSIAKRAAAAAPGAWVSGSGWDEAKFAERRMPSRRDIDAAAAGHPVWLEHTTGHYGLANGEALRLAGIDRTTRDPVGGIIDRFPDGSPTGVLRENATALVSGLIPPVTPAEREQAFARFSVALLTEGMTALKDPGIGQEDWDAYTAVRKKDSLAVRVFVLWRSGLTLAAADSLIAKVGAFTKPYESIADDRLISGGVKLFLDGSGGGRTAWVYNDWNKNGTQVDVGNKGFPTADPALFRQIVRRYHDAGFHIGTHAIGDRAIDWLVDSYAEALAANPLMDRRHSIIHAVMPTPHAIDVMADLQKRFDAAIPESSAPFTWWIGDLYASNFGQDRMARTNPFHTFATRGIRWAGASDHFVTPFPARYGIWSSVAREPLLGTYGKTPFGTAEAATVHEALRSYTIWAAHQLFLDKKVGSSEVGKIADLAVWDRDPYTVPTADLKEMRCEMTLVDGRVVYERPVR